MITNKSINIIECEAYLSHKLSAIIRDNVSTQIRNNHMHVTERDKSIRHSNQSINEKITHVGPPTKARFISTGINSISSIIFGIMKFIHAYFKTFLKIMENVENVYQREDGNKFLSKMGFLGPKNSNDEKVKS